MTRSGPIRVASIPARHPYVEHLAVPPVDNPDGVVRLPDPAPDVPDPQPGQWWPPVILEAGWPTAHAGEFDIAHLHFGFDAADPVDLQRWVDELRELGRPLVITVHDLVNPHFVDQAAHASRLDVLIPHADALITLTPGAAAEIAARWGRRAEVIGHPHIVPLCQLPATDSTAPGTDGFVIGVHAKSLRANLDPVPVLAALEVAIDALPNTRVRVDVHPDVLTRADPQATAFREFLQRRENDPKWDFQVHGRFTDDELWDYLGGLDLCVLPYRFGTHSGWLEACVDVGTAVLVPATGHFAGQHGHPSYPRATDGTVDQQQFTATLRAIRDDPVVARPARPDRLAQRRQIAAAHERVYRRVLAGGVSDATGNR
jgi:beta-1,4-mannosyltransferase